ncbi:MULTISPECIES: universal stress protein [Kitasatospora]|uniref:Universal stress protein n=1 Tax=Kitasatospora cystarginea TaxID=58350 RepID=A0ABN3DY18_9ACTN
MGGTVGSEHRIVVGVDGSELSKQALRWAIEQARLTGAVVDAVIAWIYPTVYGWAMTKRDPQLDHTAEKVLSDTVEDVAGPEPQVEIRQSSVPGNATEVLLERSRGADLLVLGSRGLGGFAGALLGSVSRHCVQHATCPVVVVPGVQGREPASALHA